MATSERRGSGRQDEPSGAAGAPSLELDLCHRMIRSVRDFAIFALSPEARIMTWNPGAERLFGFAADEIVGRDFSALFTRESRAKGAPARELAMARETGAARDESWHLRKDGSRFWGSGAVHALRDAGGRLIGFTKIVQDLTEQRMAAERLDESEQGYRSLFAYHPDAVFSLDLEGNFTSVNPASERISGYTAAELVGTSFDPLVVPEDKQAAWASFARALSGEPQSLELGIRHKDGWLVRLSTASVPIVVHGQVRGIFSVAKDITEREAAERERAELLARERDARSLAEQAERRAALLSDASRILASSLDYVETLKSVARVAIPTLADLCAVHIVEPGGTLKQVEIAHVSAQKEAAARELQERYPVDPSREESPVARVLGTGRPVLVSEVRPETLTGLARDDTHLELVRRIDVRSFMVLPLTARGRVLGTMAFAITESDRRYGDADVQLAGELARRASVAVDNAQLYREALVANQAKSDFLAVVSHELRTPLNAILGYSELLVMGVPERLPEGPREQVERIGLAARHLLGLIDEVLSFSRIEAGREEVRIAEVDLTRLVREVAELTAPIAREKGLAYRVELPGQPAVVRTDAGKIRQILLNLLSNAIKFTEQGEIGIDTRVDGDWISIRVRDTGIGIPHEQHEHIFNPFWQVEQTTTRRRGGTGLGLSVSRQLARMLGGDVTLASTPGKGSTFTVRLPARPGSHPAAGGTGIGT